jgi:GH15 family glucan-1,4-alpha-glucosidase
MTRLLLLTLLLSAAPAAAQPQRTWSFLTTGNGYGFQIYDSNAHKITQFLEHPYRYLAPNPSNARAEGLIRRNLAYDFFFGIRGGGSSGWLDAPTSVGDPGYLDQTHIIRAPASLGSIAAESYFFAPFDYPGNALIALIKAPGASDGFALFNFHMGDAGSPDRPDSNNESIRYVTAQKAIVETGPGGGFMVYVPLSGVDVVDCAGAYAKVTAGQDLADNRGCSGNDVVPAFQKHLGADGWMAVAILFVDSKNGPDADAAAAAIVQWANGRAPDQLLADARAEFDRWRKPPPANVSLCGNDETALWRQSEAVLRMGQIQEPNTPTRFNHGMILASLPPGSWHTGWVRDATYAVAALARSGHTDEAKAALQFFLNAQPVGAYSHYVRDQNYRISLTRYFGNGQEECDWNNSGPNTETDGWGLVLWAARQYVEASGDTAWLSSATPFGTVYDVLKGQLAAPLEANLEASSIMRPDSSIWEVHQPGKHYAYTTMAAARGFCDVAALAKRAGKNDDVSHYSALSAKVKHALVSTFVDPQMALGGSLEGLSAQVYYDGSLAEAFLWNLLPDLTGPVATATLDLFNHLRVDSGGFKRNNDGLSSYDNNEWILVDLRISDALRRAGRTQSADQYFGQIVKKAAANFYLLPELYNDTPADGQIGKYFGSIPMVGYGAGAYVLTILDRAGAWEPNDCGDGNSKSGAAFSCGGAVGSSDGGVGGGNGNSSGGSGGNNSGSDADGGTGNAIAYRAACLCSFGATKPARGTMTVLALPWLFLTLRLCARARCK